MKKYLLLPAMAIVILLNSCASGQAQSSNLSPKDFASKIEDTKGAQLIDVRTPEEYANGHLKNAQNIDWKNNDFDKMMTTFDKEKPVLIYCLSGGRSGSAASRLVELGFKKVYNMDGGFIKWRAEQLPETKDNTVQKSSEMNRADYDKLIKSDEIVLIDFYADWCGPCKKMKPSLDEIAQEMEGKMTLIRIDADENAELCQDLSIDALPTLMVYNKGTMMWHNVGYISKDEILQHLK